MKIGSEHKFAEAIAALSGMTTQEVLSDISEAVSQGAKPWESMVRTSRVTLFDVLVAALMSNDSDTAARTIELDDSDEIPEFDIVIDSGVPALLAVGERSDPAKRALILCDRKAESYSNSAVDMFLLSLDDHDMSPIGLVFLSGARLDLIRSANKSQASASIGASSVDQHNIFDEITRGAISEGASDIHLTVGGGVTRIAIRVNGDLVPWNKVSLNEDSGLSLLRSMYNSLADRSSVKGEFNATSEQDAVIERSYETGRVRFRYSGLPVEPNSVDVTLRIIHIGARARPRSMVDLGYAEDQSAVLDRMFSKGGGLILFAGTTGSGKSTSMANRLARYTAEHPTKKVRTVEEPVEYRIPGAYQTSVRRLKGDSSDFLRVLRQMMRADPDVLMIGEIRDNDTADLTIQSVRSGHLTISTLHANSAPVCFDRLAGMGINRLDLASVGLIHGLVYQKLVQVLCPHCKIPSSRYRRALDPIGSMDRLQSYLHSAKVPENDIHWRNPSGCKHCRNRGISGREVCAEILVPRPDMLAAVATGDSGSVWRSWRRTINRNNSEAMMGRTSFEHALHKMVQSKLSPSAVESEFGFLDDLEYEYVDKQIAREDAMAAKVANP